MGVYCEGMNYDIPKDIFFSVPVYCKDGDYQIVEGLQLNEFQKEKIKACIDELLEEKEEAFEEILIP